MVRRVDLEGAARLVLASGVRCSDEATAVFGPKLEGWERQQGAGFCRWR